MLVDKPTSKLIKVFGKESEEIVRFQIKPDQIGKNSDWDRIFGQSPGRNKLYYFQKLDAGKFNITFGLDGFK